MFEESFTSVAAWSLPAAVTSRVMGPLRAVAAWIATGGSGRGRSEAATRAATASTNAAATARRAPLIRTGGGGALGGTGAGRTAGSAGSRWSSARPGASEGGAAGIWGAMA